jgi:hypothetical protein
MVPSASSKILRIQYCFCVLLKERFQFYLLFHWFSLHSEEGQRTFQVVKDISLVQETHLILYLIKLLTYLSPLSPAPV